MIFVVVLLNLGFSLNFYNGCVAIYYPIVFYGTGYVSNNFILLDVEYFMYNYDEYYFSLIAHSNDSNVDENI